ncbi:hypothetical protein ASPFODRAFT_592988 [Aspergillus luchuensis CBS 106.47]|uniref:Uncharacterized protein n=1 Tax=Aspergillus luchuensis (strain CBS 106.47) TaxID=1137211 RepID=A0A1M3SYI9_ASPLC|nr:hypothetical protein ASPFODRAFT_592988 [Aspergillus luchuensis CBS 106.47]
MQVLVRRPFLYSMKRHRINFHPSPKKMVQAVLRRWAAKRCMTIVAVTHILATVPKADTAFVFGVSQSRYGFRSWSWEVIRNCYGITRCVGRR